MDRPLSPSRVSLRYDVDRVRDDWVLPEETVPESRSHDLVLDLLKALLVMWARRAGRTVQVGRNLAIRWEQNRPSVGVDPDIYVVEPPPPEGDQVTSLRLWEPGHAPPLLAIEVVSRSNATKDYAAAPDKYAACGAKELWIFDPGLAGPTAHGGPLRLQVWARDDEDAFVRTYAGEGPVFSKAVGGWLFAVDEGQQLRIADDAQGTSWWMTAEEAERAAKEAERAAKEEALRRLAEIEAELARLKARA
jgi:Uma2 family endonuclease